MKILTMLIALCGVALVAESARAAKAPAGRVLSVRGTATVTSGGAKTPLTRGTRLAGKVTISTGIKSAARILLADRSVLDLGPSTVVRFDKVGFAKKKRKVKLRLTVGRLWARVSSFFGGGAEFEVDCHNAVVGVRGTDLIVEVDDTGGTIATVVTGAAEIANLSGKLRKNIGPMMTSTFDGTTIEVGPADAARIAAIAIALGPTPNLTPMDVDGLRQQGLVPKKPRVGPALLDLIDTPAPPLAVEPGAFGTVDVNGTAEFKE